MWCRYAMLAGLFLASDAVDAPAETFRLETVVDTGDESCRYTLSRAEWTSKINGLLRSILEINIQHVRLEQVSFRPYSNNKNNRLEDFKSVYRGISVDGDGGEIVSEIYEIEGVALLGKDNLIIKITKVNSPIKPFLAGKFITCEPVSVPADIPLSLEDMKKMEINKVRQAELKFGDAVDDLTSIGAKAVSEPLGKAAGFLVEEFVDKSTEENKARRHELLKSKNLSFVEKERVKHAERTSICNALWGSGGC